MSVLMILMHIAIHMNDVISCIHIASNHITSYPMYSNYTDVLSPTALKYNMNESTPRNMCVIHIYIYIYRVSVCHVSSDHCSADKLVDPKDDVSREISHGFL